MKKLFEKIIEIAIYIVSGLYLICLFVDFFNSFK